MVWVPPGVRRSNEDIAYCAGLFDGEGCVMYKQYSRSRNKGKTSHLVWKITLEINMIELDPLHYFYNTFRVGTISHKSNLGFSRKDQWRWRCSHRQAFEVTKKIYPFSIVKRPKLLKVINHYEYEKPIGVLQKKYDFSKF